MHFGKLLHIGLEVVLDGVRAFVSVELVKVALHSLDEDRLVGEHILYHSVFLYHLVDGHFAVMRNPAQQRERSKQKGEILIYILELHGLLHDDLVKRIGAILFHGLY